MTNGKITIASALSEAVAYLKNNPSILSPRLDCEILLCHLLHWERIQLILEQDAMLESEIYATFRKYVVRRAQNEPVSYITGKKEFMSLEFAVRPGILIPRPETELLVEYITRFFAKHESSNILDLCTGSGAIAVSVAHGLPNAVLDAVDKFDICIQTTKENAKTHHVSDRVRVVKRDIFGDFPDEHLYDCIVSNPPYIQKDVLSALPDDVKCFEPSYALDGGEDGLMFYRRISELAENYLKPHGLLVLEIGYDQGEDLRIMLENAGVFQDINITKDYAGLDRMVTAIKRG